MQYPCSHQMQRSALRLIVLCCCDCCDCFALATAPDVVSCVQLDSEEPLSCAEY